MPKIIDQNSTNASPGASEINSLILSPNIANAAKTIAKMSGIISSSLSQGIILELIILIPELHGFRALKVHQA